eukprot:g23049.t1
MARFSDEAVSSYVDNLLKRVITGRPAAEVCSRQFVKRVVGKVLARTVEGAQDVTMSPVQAKQDATQAEQERDTSEVKSSGQQVLACGRDVAAGCARVAVARWLEKAKANRDQGSEREQAASAAKIAASEAASRAGERKVAAVCARIAVARFMDKAKAWAVKRNESKAFERSVEEGDARQIAALCARHAVKLYLDKATDAIQQGSARTAVEQVHSAVLTAASRIAAVSQPTIQSLEGLISEEDMLDNSVSPTGAKSPMKPSGTAPKKKRPTPKASWTAPPSPEQFEADLRQAETSNYFMQERKRDVELLQKRHHENLQRVRQVQEELRSEHNLSYLKHLAWCLRTKMSCPRVPPKPKPAKGGRGGGRSRGVKPKGRTECSRRSSSERPSKAIRNTEGELAPDSVPFLPMEAEMPRPDLDDPVLRAYLAVYKSTVCKRGDDFEACNRGAGSFSCSEVLADESRGKRPGAFCSSA